ncbi:protein FAM183A [Labrus bergylta]|uniref:protein FAM183A n=1 Tax=Labrus bergylta TaxID=56723 RepID=UPI0033131950
MAEREKEKPNVVHQDAIFVETVRKELRCEKLHTEFGFNPNKTVHVLPEKPLGRKPPEVFVDTSEFIDAIRRARMEPTKKYPMPQTESQEIGWWAAPLIPPNRDDGRLHFHRAYSDITRHKESALMFSKKTEKEKTSPEK